MTGHAAKIEPTPHGGSPSSRPGMGSLPFAGGAAFRVWAPHAEAVAVAGDFNDWSDESDRLRAAIAAEGWEVRDDPDGYRLVPAG